jgi:hypothetical protein
LAMAIRTNPPSTPARPRKVKNEITHRPPHCPPDNQYGPSSWGP